MLQRAAPARWTTRNWRGKQSTCRVNNFGPRFNSLELGRRVGQAQKKKVQNRRDKWWKSGRDV